MIKICDNLIDISAIEISDLVDMQKLVAFQETYAGKTGCALTVVDRNGNCITPTSKFCKYCEYYIRSSSEGLRECNRSHSFFISEAMRYHRIHIAKCHAGITEFAFPIVLENEVIGGVVGGHYTIERMRPADIRECSDRYGVNIDNLKNAAEELERLSKKEIEAIATAVKTAIEAMVNEAYFKKQTAVVSEVFAKTIGVVSENFEKMSKASERIETHQRELSKNIENIGEASEKIEDVLDSITRLADQTKILSFNAQIEAVRAGAAGKSFVVVAGEIKDLADTSKATAEDIATLTTAIKSDVESTVTSSEKTIESADEQSDYIDDASENVEELQILAKQFSKFVAKNTKQ